MTQKLKRSEIERDKNTSDRREHDILKAKYATLEDKIKRQEAYMKNRLLKDKSNILHVPDALLKTTSTSASNSASSSSLLSSTIPTTTTSTNSRLNRSNNTGNNSGNNGHSSNIISQNDHHIGVISSQQINNEI